MIQSSQLSEALQVQSNDQELALFQTVPSVSGARKKKKRPRNMKMSLKSSRWANQIVFLCQLKLDGNSFRALIVKENSRSAWFDMKH